MGKSRRQAKDKVILGRDYFLRYLLFGIYLSISVKSPFFKLTSLSLTCLADNLATWCSLSPIQSLYFLKSAAIRSSINLFFMISE